MLCRELDDQIPMNHCCWLRQHNQASIRRACKCGYAALDLLRIIHANRTYLYPERRRGLDHLSPFLRIFGHELPEVGVRARKWCGAKVGIARLEAGALKPGVDLAIEPFDDFGWRADNFCIWPPGMAWLEVSHLRIARERPTSTRAARNCEPISRITVMEKLCAHW